MKRLLFSAVLFLSGVAFAAGEDDFDGLGGNKILLERAQALNPESDVTIVQPRTVSLRNRFEIAPEYSGVFGGDTYTDTQSIGLNVTYHITPRWAVGVKHNISYNRLTPEGAAMMDRAYAAYQNNPKSTDAPIPDIDFPKSETLGLVSWSPVYGKINLLDKKVVQFDGYLTAGAGSVVLSSGATQTQTAGGGLAFWWSPKLSTKLEMRYQKYQVQYYDGPKDLDLAVASVQMGWLL